VETPAFGTKTRGFFKENGHKSRESSRESSLTGGFVTSATQSKTKKLKGSMVEKSTGSNKILATANPQFINETMVASTKRAMQEKLRPQAKHVPVRQSASSLSQKTPNPRSSSKLREG